MKKLAKFLSYLWPVIAISYIVGFSFLFTEWLEHIDHVQDKWQMAASMPVFFLAIIFLFMLHHLYGKLVKWIAK